MRANAQISMLAERLFTGSSYNELLESASVDRTVCRAETRVRDEKGIEGATLSDGAWLHMRHSLAESLAWMLLFRVPEERLQGVVDAWVAAQGEMLRRLAADQALIETRFNRDARRITSLDLDLSDRHCGGRTVAVLTFDSGLRLVYKPRDIGIEAWFASFQERLNGLGAPFPFRHLRAIACEGYGWTEFAAHSPCPDEDQLRSFYRNSGALLCLLHLLRATDCHFENLIACGESPVLVDSETLFQPSLLKSEDGSSILRTGMIPRFNSALEAAPHDFGALSCVSPQRVPVPIPAADGRGARLETALLIPETNVPFAPGYDPAPELYVEEMLEGFGQTWQFANAHRAAILDAVESARSQRIRYVVRDTLTYYQAIVAALHAGSIRDLILPPLPPEKTVLTGLEADELLALRGLDIPRFTLAAAETGLAGVANCFPQSGFDLACRGLEKLSEKELQKQCALIRVCWGLYGAAKSLAQPSGSGCGVRERS
jgi:type 2 lantibiotic biosynthesis protein LanM